MSLRSAAAAALTRRKGRPDRSGKPQLPAQPLVSR